MTKEFEFNNGDQVSDKVTGFTGSIVGISFYLTGCTQYLLMPECTKPHKKAVGQWFDEARLDLVVTKKFKAKDVTGNENGADMPVPGGKRESQKRNCYD